MYRVNGASDHAAIALTATVDPGSKAKMVVKIRTKVKQLETMAANEVVVAIRPVVVDAFSSETSVNANRVMVTMAAMVAIKMEAKTVRMAAHAGHQEIDASAHAIAQTKIEAVIRYEYKLVIGL